MLPLKVCGCVGGDAVGGALPVSFLFLYKLAIRVAYNESIDQYAQRSTGAPTHKKRKICLLG